MKRSSGSAAGPRRRAGQVRRRRAPRRPRRNHEASTAARATPRPGVGAALPGSLLLEYKRPELFTHACRSVAFHVSRHNPRLSRQLFKFRGRRSPSPRARIRRLRGGAVPQRGGGRHRDGARPRRGRASAGAPSTGRAMSSRPEGAHPIPLGARPDPARSERRRHRPPRPWGRQQPSVLAVRPAWLAGARAARPRRTSVVLLE
jgi:hypothetical protein